MLYSSSESLRRTHPSDAAMHRIVLLVMVVPLAAEAWMFRMLPRSTSISLSVCKNQLMMMKEKEFFTHS